MAEIAGTMERIPGVLLDIGGIGHNVKHPNYGAKGDGVTDDTAAIVAALLAADVVILPPGTYAVSEDIEIAAGKSIIGAGFGTTTILWIGGAAPAVAVLTAAGLDENHLLRFTVDGATHPETSFVIADTETVEIFIDRVTQGFYATIRSHTHVLADITDYTVPDTFNPVANRRFA